MATTPDDRVELRLTLRAHESRHDIALEAEAGTRVAAVFAEAGLTPRPGEIAWCPRQQRAFALHEPIGDCGLRHGDVFELDREQPTTPPAVALGPAGRELVVASGPSAGRRRALVDAVVSVGRGEECDVQVDDPSMSVRHLEVRDRGGFVDVRDLDSSNGTSIAGTRIDARQWVAVPEGGQIEAGRTLLKIDAQADRRRGGTAPIAKRPPRARVKMPPLAFEIAAPPEPAHRARLPFIAALIPMVGGIALWLLLDNATMLVFTALSPMMVLGTWISDRRAGRQNEAAREGRWRSELDEQEQRLRSAIGLEEQARRAGAPDAGTLVARAIRNLPELWERRRSDGDVLSLRVGVADLPSEAQIKVGRGGPPELRAEAQRRLNSHATLVSMPVTIELDGAIAGVCGEPHLAQSVARWITIQTAILHSPLDVLVCAAVPRGDSWDCVGWLPHAYAGRSPWGGRMVARDTAQADDLLRAIVELQARRLDDRQARLGDGARDAEPRVLLVVDERIAPRRDLVETICSNTSKTGVSLVYVGSERSDLPGECRWVIEAAADRAVLEVSEVPSSTTIPDVSAESVAVDLCDEVARALSPVRDAGAASDRTGEIPDRVSLLELLDMREVTMETIRERWDASSPTLGAPVGVGLEGPVDLDLVTRGPHALLVGTTGSGKSEFLKALVASLVATHPPSDLHLLLLDFKGGAAFLPFKDVPHVVGLASELDADAARRALSSLSAEAERRQRLFNDAGVPDLVTMRRLSSESAPALLLVAVDEFGFAEEAAPGFIESMVAVAKKGRSQGIHLLLANQQLDSTFAGGILKNTNLRIALRVLAPEESENIVGTKAAARLPEERRGRGFWRQVGSAPSEFQGAYVSGWTRRGASAPLVVRSFADGYVSRDEDGPASGNVLDTDFDALHAAVIDAHRQSGAPSPQPLWQAPLPDVVPLATLDAYPVAAAVADGSVTIGLVDHPSARRRDPLQLDLVSGNVAILGPGGSGRTSALRTVAAALAMRHTADELHLYAIDDGTRQLASIAALAHCGDVVPSHDLERLELLLRRLIAFIDERSALLARTGAVSVNELAGDIRPPRVVLLLDGIAQFNEATSASLMPHAELLARVISAGRQAGVHVVLSSDRRSAIAPPLQPHIGMRITLRPGDDELLMAGQRMLTQASFPPGRGILDDGSICHVAVAGDDPARQAEAVADIARRTPVAVAGPRPVRALPPTVDRAKLPATRGMQVPVGLQAPDLDPAYVDLSARHLLVLGALHSGRSTTLETIARGLLSAGELETYLITPRRSPLATLDGWTNTAQGAAALELVTALLDRCDEDADPWAVLIIDDGHELGDHKLEGALERLTSRGRDGGVRLVAACDLQGARIGPPWLRGVRGDSHAMLLMPQSKDEGALVGADIPFRPPAPWVPGRGWLTIGHSIRLVQAAQ